jgi:hypothetical protein
MEGVGLNLPRNVRWLRACLEGSCLQLPRFFANANEIIFTLCKIPAGSETPLDTD